MPTFLHSAHALDRFKCDCCGQTFPKALIHEHHVIKRASGGGDTVENILRLDVNCHSAIHQVEMALKNPKRRGTVSDLVGALFPKNITAQKRCLELAATAALGHSPDAPPDYSIFDSDEMVTLTPTRVPPKVKSILMRVIKELRNPRTGKKLGVSEYVRGLIEADLKKRGFTF